MIFQADFRTARPLAPSRDIPSVFGRLAIEYFGLFLVINKFLNIFKIDSSYRKKVVQQNVYRFILNIEVRNNGKIDLKANVI